MATCKDCLHIGVCPFKRYRVEKDRMEKRCSFFKDRSRFVELPCVAGEYVYVIEPIFGKSIERTISRRKIKSIEPNAEVKFYGGWIRDYFSAFGRYIFSTYEEAEQALKEREENAN